jgi:hypothetical protein
MEIAGCGAVGLVWGDEGCNGDCGRISKEFGDLKKVMLVHHVAHVWRAQASRLRHARDLHKDTHLCYPPDILIPVFLGKTQVLVETEAHIVAVKAICCKSKMEEVLLKSCRDRRFTGR